MLGNEVLNKEQLYDLFQQILGIKKFEHQLLYNAMQLENTDEQAAAIRRELDARQERLQEMQRVRLQRQLHLQHTEWLTDWLTRFVLRTRNWCQSSSWRRWSPCTWRRWRSRLTSSSWISSHFLCNRQSRRSPSFPSLESQRRKLSFKEK